MRVSLSSTLKVSWLRSVHLVTAGFEGPSDLHKGLVWAMVTTNLNEDGGVIHGDGIFWWLKRVKP